MPCLRNACKCKAKSLNERQKACFSFIIRTFCNTTNHKHKVSFHFACITQRKAPFITKLQIFFIHSVYINKALPGYEDTRECITISYFVSSPNQPFRLFMAMN